MHYPIVNLRDYQLDMLTRIHEAWRGCRSVMAQMPTGTGKTHVLAAVIRGIVDGDGRRTAGTRQACPTDKRGEVWIVAHRRELVEQIEATVGRYGISMTDGTVRAMSIQWLSRHWNDVDGKPILIVIDEAHHSPAASYRELWERYPEAKILGMTATPCRMSGSGFARLFDTLVSSWSIAEFIRKGQLSLFDYISIRPDSEEQILIDNLEKRGADGDYQVKEMDAALNRRPSIERLFRSVCQYAHGKKGIVYAISIDHARQIADFYRSKGLNAAAIDSKTPAAERQRLIDDFRLPCSGSGGESLQVIVNVDVFSEGFDCPDVEFIQMARPTLSLSKYLQQVGRGLRKSGDKACCVLIDNVGLYQRFGLPTRNWDWDAMFHGYAHGRAVPTARFKVNGTGHGSMSGNGKQDDGMVVVARHDALTEAIGDDQEKNSAAPAARHEALRACKDKQSGLWLLRRGREYITADKYADVFGIKQGMAAVRLSHGHGCGVVDESGRMLWQNAQCRALKFGRNMMAVACLSNGKECYLDLYSLRMYDKKPTIERYGNIELLKSESIYYSRTRRVYTGGRAISRIHISQHGFYLTIFDNGGNSPHDCKSISPDYDYSGYVCLLDGDHDSYYRMHKWLGDGSIVICDMDGRYFHVEEGKEKRLIGNAHEPDGIAACLSRIAELSKLADDKHLIR